MSLNQATARVSADRAAALTLDLVSIPSPTGDTVEVSDRFAAELRDLGMEVTFCRDYPATPVVIGRLPGTGGGPTLILNGHLDVVPVPHPDPERKDGRVYGRGTIDMKGPLASGVEALRAAREAGLTFPGDVVLCAHGLHEAPGGHAEDLIAALQSGALHGDAAMVLEIGHDALPVAGLGSGIYEAHFRRPDGVTHELMTPAGTPHPAFAAAEAALAIRELNERLSHHPIERVGPETIFIGQLHSGDFFNRFSNDAWLEGTRRYGPENTLDNVGTELRSILQPIADRWGLLLDFTITRVRDGFRIAEDHPLVHALRTAYSDEMGRELPLTGIKIVADAPVFDKVGGIPCLYHGLDGLGAHGDLESVAEAELARAARVYLRTVAGYFAQMG